MKNHPWFAEVTWDRLARKDIDAPYIPPVKGGQGDASQFDMYPEETEAYGAEGDDPYVSSLLSLISLLDTIPAYLHARLRALTSRHLGEEERKKKYVRVANGIPHSNRYGHFFWDF